MPRRLGDTVRIVDGPFEDFVGVVISIDDSRQKLTVTVNMFGRQTAVELSFLQVKTP